MRSAGKPNSPLALLTTVMAIVEPSFLALMRTPSISPSSAEDTLPLRAAVWANAPVVATPASTPAKLAVAKSLLDIITFAPSADHSHWIRQYGLAPPVPPALAGEGGPAAAAPAPPGQRPADEASAVAPARHNPAGPVAVHDRLFLRFGRAGSVSDPRRVRETAIGTERRCDDGHELAHLTREN